MRLSAVVWRRPYLLSNLAADAVSEKVGTKRVILPIIYAAKLCLSVSAGICMPYFVKPARSGFIGKVFSDESKF